MIYRRIDPDGTTYIKQSKTPNLEKWIDEETVRFQHTVADEYRRMGHKVRNDILDTPLYRTAQLIDIVARGKAAEAALSKRTETEILKGFAELEEKLEKGKVEKELPS